MLLVLALASAASLAEAADAVPAAHAPAQAEEDFDARVSGALELYRGGRYAQARAAFEAALPQGAPADRPNLEFNIAACDYELGRYSAAEERWLLLAHTDPESRASALARAGLAALARGDGVAAQRHLTELSEAGGQPSTPERARLVSAIVRWRAAQRADTFARALDQGEQAVAAARFERARAELLAAQALESAGSPPQRARLYYLLGLVAVESGQPTRAREYFQLSRSFDPGDGSADARLGDLAEDAGQIELAARHYQASLERDLSPGEQTEVRYALETLYPLPAPGAAVFAQIAAGWDSNAAQSGSGNALGVASGVARGSPYTAPSLGLDVRFRAGPQVRLAPYYRGDSLILLESKLRELSLQTHEAGLKTYWAPTRSLSFRLHGATSLSLSGSSNFSPFTFEGVLGLSLDAEHTDHLGSSLLLELRPSAGLGQRQYLSGVQTEVALGERWQSGPWSAQVDLGLRDAALGTLAQAVDPAALPRCGVACVAAKYRIPIGYLGDWGALRGQLALTRALALSANAKLEHRHYLGQSYLEGLLVSPALQQQSSKSRVDLRVQLGARTRYRIRSDGPLAIWLDYAWRLSRSNVAYRANDLAHDLDYDDRNFNQQTVEAGIEARY